MLRDRPGALKGNLAGQADGAAVRGRADHPAAPCERKGPSKILTKRAAKAQKLGTLGRPTRRCPS